MAKPKKGETASTSSRKSAAASIKSTLTSVAKKAEKVVASTKRKAEKLLSPKRNKKQKKDAVNAPADTISLSSSSDSDSSPDIAGDKPSKKGKDGDVNASASKEDRDELGKLFSTRCQMKYSRNVKSGDDEVLEVACVLVLPAHPSH